MVSKTAKKTPKSLHLSKIDIEKIFNQLSDQWRKEVEFFSLSIDIVMNQNYQEIIGLGPAVVPILLRELQKEPDDWFYALKVITRENPINPDDRGDIDKMAQAWVEWGRQKGYL